MQFVVTFASTCAVVEASRVYAAPDLRSGYHSTLPGQSERSDRRIGDLARVDRKRREAEQQASRRGLEIARSGLLAGANDALRTTIS
jgi:hypothetical protein